MSLIQIILLILARAVAKTSDLGCDDKGDWVISTILGNTVATGHVVLVIIQTYSCVVVLYKEPLKAKYFEI